MPDTAAPPNPYLILAAALILPGSGQVWNRAPLRGLIFVFFIILMGAFTLKTADPGVSVIGKLAGGIFVWALSVLEAYKVARIRTAQWNHGQSGTKPAPKA